MRDHTLRIAGLIEDYLTGHFTEIYRAEKSGNINPAPQSPFLYPTHLLLVESQDHIIVELLGCRSDFDKKDKLGNKLIVAKRTITFTEDHFDQFGARDGSPAVTLGTSHSVLTDLLFTRTEETPALVSRLPSIRGFERRYNLRRPDGAGSLIAFTRAVECCVLKSCSFVNAREGIFRLKSVHFAPILHKDVNPAIVSTVLKRDLPPKTACGVVERSNAVATAMLLSGQFQSLYLSPTVHETTIGSFLSAHPQLITNALGAVDHIYEPTLPWVDKPSGVDREAINPDMLLRRPDGFWDIVDFKTAALDRTNLTKGGHARRRFIDYVYEGLAQLANYADYFSFPANLALAQQKYEKYGIKISEPRLVLVVGSTENCDPSEVRQALRAHSNAEIIDYDTLLGAYTASVETTSNAVESFQSANKIGRNDRCPCGSGKKFKRCHGAP
jgi:hypothetical protein